MARGHCVSIYVNVIFQLANDDDDDDDDDDAAETV